MQCFMALHCVITLMLQVCLGLCVQLPVAITACSVYCNDSELHCHKVVLLLSVYLKR
jgi:hypothetical protein